MDCVKEIYLHLLIFLIYLRIYIQSNNYNGIVFCRRKKCTNVEKIVICCAKNVSDCLETNSQVRNMSLYSLLISLIIR